MSLTKEDVALRMSGLPSYTARELQQVFEKIIADVAAVEAGEVSDATTSAAGAVKQAANQADSTATDAAGLVTDFNTLLAALKTAGIMAADA